MISLADAQRELVAACPRVAAVELPIGQACGCVVAADVAARQPVPPFHNSAVDGYAVQSADVSSATTESPVELSVLGSVLAGSVADRPVGTGQAWKVMTGAALPAGADAVVMVEDTSAERDAPAAAAGDTVAVRAAVAPEDGIRRIGSDVNIGDVVAAEGTVLRPAHLGVLASVGVRTVRAYPRLRVGLLVTGDELVTSDRRLEPGEIYESNGALLTACIEQAGCVPVDLGVAGDDADALAKRLLDAAATCDAIVTTGGVSMGDADPVKAALSLLGRLHWMQVQIRPAKPFAYAVLDGPSVGVPVFGLPGNPVSSLVSFELLARPALRSMMGQLVVAPAAHPGHCGRTAARARRRADHIPAGELAVRRRRPAARAAGRPAGLASTGEHGPRRRPRRTAARRGHRSRRRGDRPIARVGLVGCPFRPAAHPPRGGWPSDSGAFSVARTPEARRCRTASWRRSGRR